MTKTKDRITTYGKDVEKSGRDMQSVFEGVTKSALTLFAVFAGGQGLKEFIADTTNANAAIGRLAANLNMAPEDLSAFQNAVYKSGGSAEGAAASLQGLADMVVKLKTEGAGPNNWLWRIGGFDIDTSKGPLATYLQLAEKLEKYKGNREEKNYIARQLGLDPGTANFTLQGIAKIKQAIADSMPDAVTKRQAEAAGELQKAWRGLEVAAESLGNKIVENISGPLEKSSNDMKAWFEEAKSVIDWVEKVDEESKHWEIAKNLNFLAGNGAAHGSSDRGNIQIIEEGIVDGFRALFGPGVSSGRRPRGHSANAFDQPLPPGSSPDAPSPGSTPQEVKLSDDDMNKMTGGATAGWLRGGSPITVGGSEVSYGNPLPVLIQGGGSGGSTSLWDWITGGSSGGGGGGGSRPSGAAGGSGGISDNYGGGGRVPSGEGLARAKHLADTLQNEYGLTRAQAAGAVGVMGYESGDFRVMQEGGQPPGRGGWGYAQWTGPRRRNFMAWAQKNKLDPSSPEANEGFLKYEIANNPAYQNAITQIKKAKTTEEAALIWEHLFEGMTEGGPGIPAFAAHVARAKAYAKALGAGLPRGGSAAGGVANHLRTSSNSTSNQVSIANLAVHTQATDAAGIVRDIRPTLTSDLFASRSNYGLA